MIEHWVLSLIELAREPIPENAEAWMWFLGLIFNAGMFIPFYVWATDEYPYSNETGAEWHARMVRQDQEASWWW